MNPANFTIIENWENISQSIRQESYILFQYVSQTRTPKDPDIIVQGTIKEIKIDTTCSHRPQMIIMSLNSLNTLSLPLKSIAETTFSFSPPILKEEDGKKEFNFSHKDFFDGRPFIATITL